MDGFGDQDMEAKTNSKSQISHVFTHLWNLDLANW
jgi:hypothetical protein